MINKEVKFDFDDIIITPAVMTTINSRFKDITLRSPLPLFTAPMDTVVDLSNIEIFIDNNVNVVLPRTVAIDDYLRYVHNQSTVRYQNVFISLGFEDIDKLFEFFYEEYPPFGIKQTKTPVIKYRLLENQHICIDVANGHQIKVLEYAMKIKAVRPDIVIMAGNIANPETYLQYAQSGAIDYVRLGIGNGGGCTTTKNGSIGYPMASLIHETYDVKEKYEADTKKAGPSIIADGGMKDYSDILKSLALGADNVMVGSIFNKSLESCGSNYLYAVRINKTLAKFFYDKGFPVKKYFRGMSTKAAQKAMGKTVLKTSEGVVRYRKIEYHLSGWLENFEHYLRSAMSYTNSKTLDEFIDGVNITRISKKSYDRFNK